MQTIDTAKQFLLGRISEQATTDGLMLTDLERRMFLFSETSPNPDWEANEKFEAEHDDSEYEQKIAKLLRHAYAQDKQVPQNLEVWRDCLRTLRGEDFYGLVMVDQAKISRPGAGWTSVVRALVLMLLNVKTSSFFLLKAGIVALTVLLLLDPLHWYLVPFDWQKWACTASAVVAIWVIGRVERRRRLSKANTASIEFKS